MKNFNASTEIFQNLLAWESSNKMHPSYNEFNNTHLKLTLQSNIKYI